VFAGLSLGEHLLWVRLSTTIPQAFFQRKGEKSAFYVEFCATPALAGGAREGRPPKTGETPLTGQTYDFYSLRN